MRTTMGRRKTRLSEEQAFERLNRVFDFDLFCLELEYNEKIGAMTSEAVQEKLDGKQRAFDAMLAVHPATLAEKAGRAEARQLDEERLGRIAEGRKEHEENRRRAGARHLVRRWHAKLAPAHAS